eukprot:scaffold128792_cov51-Phaeocystis_antarctica.AAC.3
MVNCIQGIVTSAFVSRLLNVKVSPTLLIAPSSPGPFKLISPKIDFHTRRARHLIGIRRVGDVSNDHRRRARVVLLLTLA